MPAQMLASIPLDPSISTEAIILISATAREGDRGVILCSYRGNYVVWTLWLTSFEHPDDGMFWSAQNGRYTSVSAGGGEGDSGLLTGLGRALDIYKYRSETLMPSGKDEVLHQTEFLNQF